MLPKLKLTVVFLLFAYASLAQKGSVKGIVIDSLEKKNLQYASILLIRKADSILVKKERTGADGTFQLTDIKAGNYNLVISYPKMADYVGSVALTDTSVLKLGTIRMELKSQLLNEIIIRSSKKAISMRGDTIVYQADSFAVQPNASIEELLRRLPGVEVDKDGHIKAEGKAVETVLVDGDEFFGDDPLLVTKYLKAKTVQEVEVYDKKSDRAILTGIDDGIKDKTINIKLKENAKNGYISNTDLNQGGKRYGDYGALIGAFKGKLKAGVFATKTTVQSSNKVKMALSTFRDDYESIEVSGGGFNFINEEDDGYADYSFSGLPNNLSAGAHFSDKWRNNKNSIRLNQKYHNNKTNNLATNNATELLPDGTILKKQSQSNSAATATGYNAKSAFNIKIDSFSTLKINFSILHRHDFSNSSALDQTGNAGGVLVSRNSQQQAANATSDGFDGNIAYVRIFRKRGRSLSIDLQPENKRGKSWQNTANATDYFDATGMPLKTELINLRKEALTGQQSAGSRIAYTEPLTKHLFLQSSYSFKAGHSTSYKSAFDNNTSAGSKPQPIDSLSNDFRFNSLSHIGKVLLQYQQKSLTLNGGLEATKTGYQLDDPGRGGRLSRHFINFSPRAGITLKKGFTQSFALNYSGYTRQPDIEQLQPVRDISSPLYQVIGNPDLKPAFSNNLGLSFNNFNSKKMSSLFVNMSYGFATNEIISVATVDQFGKRVESYTNVAGTNNFNVSFNYSKFASARKFSYSLGGFYYHSHNISFLNAAINKTFRYQFDLNPSLTYSDKVLRFTYNPSLSFSHTNSSLGNVKGSQTFSHNHDLSGTVQLPFKMELTTTVSLSYQPANGTFDKAFNTAVWNGALSKKILKDQSLEIKLSVNDILNQRRGYSRNVDGNYVSESTYSYLPRYLLLGVSYNLSGSFKQSRN